jgi:hypothetical protein
MSSTYYLINKKPVFLTFYKYGQVLQKCQEKGYFTTLNSFRYELAFTDKKTHKKVYNGICKYLSEIESNDSNEFLDEFYEFKCCGEEAKDNLFQLLSAIFDCYGGFHFEKTNGVISSFCEADIRYPIGKKYFICCESKHRNCGMRIFIDSELIEEFEGTMENCVVKFRSGIILDIEAGVISIYAV